MLPAEPSASAAAAAAAAAAASSSTATAPTADAAGTAELSGVGEWKGGGFGGGGAPPGSSPPSQFHRMSTGVGVLRSGSSNWRLCESSTQAFLASRLVSRKVTQALASAAATLRGSEPSISPSTCVQKRARDRRGSASPSFASLEEKR